MATPPAKNRQQQQNYSQQQPQRLSPFDELMAQHQQQLQRERQLLRLASARGQQQQRSTSAAGPSSGATISEATAAEVAAAATSGSGKLSTIPPPIPIKTSKLEDIMPHLAEPPFEYSPPARFTELPKKSLSETTADVKRGLLSSILEKVRSKEEIQQQQNSVEAAKSGGSSQPQTSTTTTKQRLMAPLASTESLSVSDASSKRLSTSVDSTASSKCTNY